ncbi:MAG: metallophosphoesterase [Pseudomonas sp.]|uniref:metallophosphoesterase n=1 Tax=Pseudomonas sp. TaxID=306 RepID=UPI0030F09418
MFHVITGLMALYVIWRLVWRLRWPASVKWALGIVVLFSCEYHLVTRTYFGSMASPELPAAVLMVLGGAFGAVVLAACLLLILDLVGAIAYLFSKPAGRALLTRLAPRASIGIAALLLSAVGVWQAVRVPDVRSIEIELAQLPAELDGFRLVQLTDLHASRLLQRPWMEAVVGKTNALAPDLTVITGDLLDGTVAARRNDVEPLRALRAKLGVYAIPGNHEYYAQYQQWLAHLNSLGLRLLLNEHVTITRGNASFVLAGITDSVAARFGQPLPDVNQALAGVAPETTVVLLSHRPPGAEDNARAGADLQLSGHTHGGQVLGLHWLTQLANDGYVSGLYQVDGMQLYVSNGTGLWNGFPLRLGKPSEITLITLRAAGKGSANR